MHSKPSSTVCMSRVEEHSWCNRCCRHSRNRHRLRMSRSPRSSLATMVLERLLLRERASLRRLPNPRTQAPVTKLHTKQRHARCLKLFRHRIQSPERTRMSSLMFSRQLPNSSASTNMPLQAANRSGRWCQGHPIKWRRHTAAAVLHDMRRHLFHRPIAHNQCQHPSVALVILTTGTIADSLGMARTARMKSTAAKQAPNRAQSPARNVGFPT